MAIQEALNGNSTQMQLSDFFNFLKGDEKTIFEKFEKLSKQQHMEGFFNSAIAHFL